MKIRGLALSGLLLTLLACSNNKNSNNSNNSAVETRKVIYLDDCLDIRDRAVKTETTFQKMNARTDNQINCSGVLGECEELLKQLGIKIPTIEKTCKALQKKCLNVK